jgi:hypothetical protein
MQHRDALDVCIADYVRSEPYETVLKPESEYESWHPKGEPPIEIAILAGEVIYQVRSALDHLMFELVKRAKGPKPLSANWERLCQFPLYTEAPATSSIPVPRNEFPSPVRDWLSDEAYAHIESVQPYHRRNNASEPLINLVKLSNIDKHRRLSTIVTDADIHDTTQIASGRIVTMHLMVEPGTELMPLADSPEVAGAPMHVKRKILIHVSFDEPSVGSRNAMRVDHVIHGVCDVGGWVARNMGVLLNRP